jgi:putative transposase
MKYRRIFLDGYSYFITLVTYRRTPLLIKNIDLLRQAFRLSKEKYNYSIDAIVVLPDHLHMILTPEKAAEYPKIITHIKRSFVYALDLQTKTIAKIKVTTSKYNRKHSGIWQDRYYEHTIRNEKDYGIKLDYIHYNPVKHGLAEYAAEWRYSSFEKFVKKGIYDRNWGDFDIDIDFE